MKAVAMESSTNFDLSIYIHYPFCKAKCPYCDFNSHRTDSSSSNLQWNDYSKFYEVYKSEIEYYARYILQGQKRKIKTIFFGGGTPSLMSGELVGGVINEIKNKIASNPEDFVDKKIEITLEANPSSVEADKFVDFSSVGVNRLSIGLQALNDNDLKTLGRVHNLNESIKAVDIARQNFDNYSIDLIYARHKQSVQEWNGELNFAIKNLAKNHISAYSLTIERGTKYFNMHKKGDIIVPDTDLSEQFYTQTNNIMLQNGFIDYEVSNYAKNNSESLHNINYWSGGDWIGIGPGAHSRVTNQTGDRYAINNIYNPQIWSQKVLQGNGAVQLYKKLDLETLATELAIMNMRYEGIDTNFIKQKFNFDYFEFINYNKLERFIEDDFLTLNNGIIKPTKRGRGVLNSIIVGFLR